MEHPYWQKQQPTAPLFPDIEWSRPEQRSMAGKLAIIGGHSGGFVAVANAFQLAAVSGIGQARAVVPDVLRRTIPPAITDIVFTASTPSGGIAKDDPVLLAAAAWADCLLLVGDSGRSAETAIAFEQLLPGDTNLVITRDAADLLMNAAARVVDRPGTTLVLSLAQLQKLFRAIYYPKMISFSMPLLALVEAVHKLTLTYPLSLVTFHQQQLVIAHKGQVTTTPFTKPLAIWRGDAAAIAACYLCWTPGKPVEALSTAMRHL